MSHGKLNTTDSATNSCKPSGQASSDMETSASSPKKHQKQWTWFVEVTPVLRDLTPKETDRQSIPISPDTSLPWSDDYNHGGWSARMFLHQMLLTSRPDWKPSDTELLLSNSTLEISRVRVDGGISLSEVLEKEPPDSSEHYLTPKMVLGLARRTLKRQRPLQRVLLRTPQGWRRRTVIVGSPAQTQCSKASRPPDKKQETIFTRAGDYVFSLLKSVRVSRDSPEAGLLAFLAHAVGQCLETQSRSRSPNSSED